MASVGDMVKIRQERLDAYRPLGFDEGSRGFIMAIEPSSEGHLLRVEWGGDLGLMSRVRAEVLEVC